MRRPAAGPAELLQAVLDRTNYLQELRSQAGTPLEIEGRVENVEELLGAATEVGTLADFLTEVSLVADTDEVDEDDSNVTLMTLHTAKGLEYPVVFMTGMEEGRFPSPAFSGRARRARRGAPPLLRGGDPGQGASLHLVRVVPEPVGARPSTTRPAGSWARSRTIWSGAAGRSSAPTAAVARRPATTWSRRPCAGAGPACRSRGRAQRHSG